LSLHPSDLRAGDWLHLAEIDFAGRTLRLAEDRVEGKPWGDLAADVDFAPGLDVGRRMDLEIDTFADAPSGRTVSLTMDLAAVLPGFAALSLGGQSLVGSAVRVYLHPVGTDRRFAMFRGLITREDFGADTEPVTADASSDPGEDHGLIHDASDTLRSFDVIDVDAEQIDTLAPVVFGAPGAGSLTGPEDHFYGTPALGLRQSGSPDWLFLIANSRTAAGEAGDDVYVWNVTKDTSGYVPAMLLADDLGVVRTVADVSAWTASVWDNGDEVWVDWNTTDGGVSRYGEQAIRGAGDVLFWLCARVRGVDMDLPRIASLAPALNSFKIDAGIWDPDGEGLRPLEWIQEYLLPILPVSLVDGPEGAFFVYWRADAGADDAVSSIDATINAERASEVESSDLMDIANDITFKYGVDAKTEKPTRVTRVTGRHDVVNTVDHARLGLFAQRSSLTFGHRQAKPIVSAAVWDDATASACLTWLERRYAMPSHAVSYHVRPDLAWLSPGDVVTLTDADLGLTDRVCLVEVVSPARSGDVLVRLRLYATA